MVPSPVETLQAQFGFDVFRPGQAEAVDSLIAGRNALVVMPTGAGKSLVYQLGAFHRPGQTLVISPLIALMKDQVDSLTARGIPATCINSAMPADEQARRLAGVARGEFRLVYLAPERLRSAEFLAVARRLQIGLLAIDEAHCLSQWGHDFRPDYLHLSAARAEMGNPLTVALTATATPRVQDDIVRLLGIPDATRVVTGFNRPNLGLKVSYCVDRGAKLRALREILLDLDEGAAIVYVGTRHEAEDVAEFIEKVVGREAQYYHAGSPSEQRTAVQEAFMSGRSNLVVATNAFGMGIDRADVRAVVHFDLPASLDAYYQEAGRAGRDGQPASAVLLYCPKDRALQEWFISSGVLAREEVRAVYAALVSGHRAEIWTALDDICLLTGLPEIKVKLALSTLEEAGALERLGDAGARMLLRLGPWNDAAVKSIANRAAARGDYRRAELAQMVAYAETDQCRRRILLDHFDDHGPAEAAWCCDNCMARAVRTEVRPSGDVRDLPDAQRAALIVLDAVRKLKWGVGRSKLSKMLKGSQAKDITKVGYDENVYYGRLSPLRSSTIEQLIDQLIALGYLKVVGARLPVLKLTPTGESAAKARLPIPLPPILGLGGEELEKKRAVQRAGGTVALTGDLFAQGLSLPDIATRRGLASSTIYGHAAQLIALERLAVSRVVPDDVAAQITTAIVRAGGAAQLGPIKALLPDTVSYDQIRCVIAHRQRGRDPARSIDDFLKSAHPRPLPGPWVAGWALGFHSGFSGEEWSRSPAGQLTYRLKYESDADAVPKLVALARDLFLAQPQMRDFDALVPVPPSVGRTFDPVQTMADALSTAVGKPVWPALHKTRQTAPQKEFHTLAQKRANVAGAFAADASVKGKRVLVLDDLFDTGATLEEVTRVLQRAGAASVRVLTLTRTIHADR